MIFNFSCNFEPTTSKEEEKTKKDKNLNLRYQLEAHDEHVPYLEISLRHGPDPVLQLSHHLLGVGNEIVSSAAGGLSPLRALEGADDVTNAQELSPTAEAKVPTADTSSQSNDGTDPAMEV